MKLTVLAARNSSYGEIAKNLLIRLSREMDVEYEIVEVNPGEEPMIAKGKELPCFIINEKVVYSGKPTYEVLKKIVGKKNGFFKLFGRR